MVELANVCVVSVSCGVNEMNDKYISVSVIMPVYNSGQYLCPCIDSLLAQTLKDIQIIIIDDASTDGSVNILKQYAQMDNRIRVIGNSIHQGAGYCRNQGMDIAQGKYVIFLDSDDYFDSHLLEVSYSAGEKYNTDIVFFDFYYVDVTKRHVEQSPQLLFMKAMEGKVFSGDAFPDRLFNVLFEVPWNKLCRLEFLLSHDIRFQEIQNSNDVYFGCCVSALAKRMTYINEYLVYYRVNCVGQISATRGKNPICAFEALKLLKTKLENEGVFDKYKIGFCSHVISCIRSALNAPGSSLDSRLLLRNCLKEYGWKDLGMSDCKAEDFFRQEDYVYWLDFPYSLDEKYGEGLFRRLCSMPYRCCLWGFGKWGKVFYEAAKYYGYSICGIIDNNPSKQGLQVDEFAIHNVSDQPDNYDAVIITNSRYGVDVLQELDSHGKGNIKIIDVGLFVDSKVPLEKCIF